MTVRTPHSSILVSHPTGNQNSRAVIEGLHHEGFLHSFHTSLASPWNKGQLAKRSFPVPFEKIKLHPWRELLRLSIGKYFKDSLLKPETGYSCVDQIYRAQDVQIAKNLKNWRPKAIYCYEDGALHSFRSAKKLGIACIYELPIAYGQTSQSLLNEEGFRYPEWKPTLIGIRDSKEKMLCKKEELELADIIICPSNFVLKSIPEFLIGEKPVLVNPYGTEVDSSPESKDLLETNPVGSPLKLLFVGELSQRKGLADLFEAIKLLNNRNSVELHIVGKAIAPIAFYKEQGVVFNYHGTCSRKQVIKHMQQADVFVLPSIVEGRALVQLEALGQGLPLIISTNTGGEDLIIEKETGFIIPIRRPDLIAEKIEWFVQHSDKIPKMKSIAKQHSQTISWQVFQQNMIHFFRKNDIL